MFWCTFWHQTINGRLRWGTARFWSSCDHSIPNCALKIPHWRSKMSNLFRIAREIFRLKIFHNIPWRKANLPISRITRMSRIDRYPSVPLWGVPSAKPFRPPYYPYFPFHQYTFDSFTGAWRIHIEGKDWACSHKIRIVGNRKLLKPQSGSIYLLKELRLPLLPW